MKFTKWCSEAVMRMIAAERRRARLRDTVMRLQDLDARALRDIGLHPGEIRSLVGEIAGLADVTRVHAALSLGGPATVSRLNPTRKELSP
jgi:uncharacterized protein YjiS (DUF1127 family)